MFPHPPQCTKQTRVNNQFGQTQDYWRPVISNNPVPIRSNHDFYMNERNPYVNESMDRNMKCSRDDNKNYRPVQSDMQSSYQFFQIRHSNDNPWNIVENDIYQLRNPVNTRRDVIEKSRLKENQEFRQTQGGVLNHFEDMRCVNTRNQRAEINTNQYVPMPRTLAIPKENI